MVDSVSDRGSTPLTSTIEKDAGLVCHHLIRSYEEVDGERREYMKLRESMREKIENGESLDGELLEKELSS